MKKAGFTARLLEINDDLWLPTDLGASGELGTFLHGEDL
jgi:hypothetical protein